jgi:tellurite resistance protein TerC
MQVFRYLNFGVAAILFFVGVKMMLSDVYKIPVLHALGVIAVILILSVVASLIHPNKVNAVQSSKDTK